MQVESIGKRSYAFGLTWLESSRRMGKAEIRAQRSEMDPSGRERFYSCVCQSQGQFSLGCGISETPLRGAVYSYAATLASLHPDGLYVAALDENRLWFAVIRGGIVTPETDVIDTADEVLARIEGYRNLLNLDPQSIYAGQDLYIEGGSQFFDPEEAVAGARKPVALRSASAPVSLLPWVLVVGVIVAAVVGIKLYRVHEAAKSKQQLSAEQRQQMIQAYHLAVQGALSAYPQDADWVVRDWSKVINVLPPFFAGWTLHDISCAPTGCDAEYQRAGNLSVYAVTPFTDRFGIAAVSIDTQGHSIRVHVSLQNPTWRLDEGVLHNPPPAPLPLLDFLGLSPGHVAGLSEQPTVAVMNLAATNGGSQVGFPSFMTETVGFNGHSPMGVALPSILLWAKHAGFRVTKVDFTTPYGNAGASDTWAITLLRFHG